MTRGGGTKAPVMLRVARAEDGPGISTLQRQVDQLHAQLWPTYFRTAQQDAWTVERVRRMASERNETLWVADCAGVVVGAIHAEIVDTPAAVPTLQPARRAFIDMLVVARSHRRAGIGRGLMERVESWAQGQGARQSVLTLWDGNLAAQSFYSAQGYQSLHRVLFRDL